MKKKHLVKLEKHLASLHKDVTEALSLVRESLLEKGAEDELNPQPLPPKKNKKKAEINPQPLPPGKKKK